MEFLVELVQDFSIFLQTGLQCCSYFFSAKAYYWVATVPRVDALPVALQVRIVENAISSTHVDLEYHSPEIQKHRE
jgi:hypothetical protein